MREIGKAKPESEEDIRHIVAGIEADEELKELAQHHFCFCPLNGSKKEPGEPCECVHSKHYRPL